jgi:hypothetical protein
MSVDTLGTAKESTAEFFAAFREAHAGLNYEAAAAAFGQALDRDPAWAFRYFVSYASGSLAESLKFCPSAMLGIARRLDALLAEQPYVHYLGHPTDPKVVLNVVKLRESNLDKGLPSMLIAPQAKSASVSVGAIFNSGFRLPSVCYSIVNLDVIDSWAADYSRGGACYVTHLIPSIDKVAQLRRVGIDQMIVHVRDPRQSLVSLIHHFDRYPDQMPEFRAAAAQGGTVSERAQYIIGLYQQSIDWISGWIDAENAIDILFSTHEQFVADKGAFVERYLDFYGADRKYFSYEDALGQHAGTDYHFRSGRTDEWREVLEPTLVDQVSAMLPERLKAKFGWPDWAAWTNLIQRRMQLSRTKPRKLVPVWS